jgi:hypothetical protein
MVTRYVVLNENTLGYFNDGCSFMGVLAGKKGGHDPKNGPIAIDGIDAIRAATRSDFDTFRVSATGHLPQDS